MSNQDWAAALAEAENPESRDAGLWARCFAEADGDEGKAKAAYVKAKVGSAASPVAAPENAGAVRKDRGWCPVCREPLDMDALYCMSCQTNLSVRGLRPLEFRPMDSKPSAPYNPVKTTADGRQMVKASKSRGVYIILGLFFGCIGIHNFYAGRYGIGAIQLVITSVLGWFVIGLVITGLWAIIEMFTVKTDGEGDAMR